MGIPVSKAVLYGSWASGLPCEHSDIDVAIVSPHFGKDRLSEGQLLLKQSWRIDPRLEPIPLSDKEFERKDWIPLIFEIKTKGKEVKID